jgi:asparagine synthase (glutamine-hydrolysing)
MMAELKHRGPDAEGVWYRDAVGLAHRMMWNTPESQLEPMPTVNARGDTVITADVRLDNREELLGLLGFSSDEHDIIGDGQLILAAYEKWEMECAAKLYGDFAFAIWDDHKKILFCARDRFGIKPFCYFHEPGRFFAFASQVKALLALSQIPREINEGRIVDFISGFVELEGIDKSSTFFTNIFRHQPAHTLIVGSGLFSSRRYWSLDPSKRIQFNSDEETAEAFLEMFTASVRSNLRSASPPGFLMSGGLDSTSIVGAARSIFPELGIQQMSTYSAVTTEGNDPETSNIQSMLRMAGLQGTMVSPDQLLKFNHVFDEFFEQSDDLFNINIFGFAAPLYNSASRGGIRIMLDGLSGDNVISISRNYILYLLRERKWADWFSESVAIHRRFYPYHPLWKTIYLSTKAELTPAWIRRLWRKINPDNKVKLKIEQHPYLNQDFAEKVGLSGRVDTARKNEHPAPPSSLREHKADILNAPHITAALERYDRVASMFSIEPRHPYLNTQLVEFCLGLPWKTGRYRGANKVMLRKSMAELLPSQVVNSKFCYSPSPLFFKKMFDLKKPYFDYIVNKQLSNIQDYIDITAVRHSYQRNLMDWDFTDGILLIKVLFLAAWMQRN